MLHPQGDGGHIALDTNEGAPCSSGAYIWMPHLHTAPCSAPQCCEIGPVCMPAGSCRQCSKHASSCRRHINHSQMHFLQLQQSHQWNLSCAWWNHCYHCIQATTSTFSLLHILFSLMVCVWIKASTSLSAFQKVGICKHMFS